MKDKIIAKFQEHLPEYIEDEDYRNGNGWSTIKGNYDMGLCLSDNQNSNERIICPICSKVSNYEPEHGVGYLCGKCQSFIRTYGNYMYVWNTTKYDKLRTERKEKLKIINKNSKVGIFTTIKNIIKNV